jgi:hypothetical protein
MSIMQLAELDRSFRPLGKHLVCCEEDILWFVIRGLVDLPEMVDIHSVSDALTERFGYALILVDSAAAKGITADARRYQNDRHRERLLPSHSALYGANVFIRSVMVLSQRATELMTGRQVPVTFHIDEATARECLRTQRAALAKTPHSG